MQAVFFTRFGAARDVLQVGELARVPPQAGELQVRLHASGLNPYDVKYRQGLYDASLPFPLLVPHGDGAGVVTAAGSPHDAHWVGQRVWLWSANQGRPFGTAAQWVSVPTGCVAPLPAGVSFAQGASLGIPLFTAYQALRKDGAIEGLTVYVSGGGGSVGFFAVQLAKRFGARVIASVGSQARRQLALEAGADLVLDYRHDDLAREVKSFTGGRGVDRLIEVEFGRNLPLVPQLLARGGKVFAFGSAQEMKPVLDFKALNGLGVDLCFRSVHVMDPALRAAGADELGRLMAHGLLRFNVAARFALADCARAHECLEQGAVAGSVVLDIDPDLGE